MSSSSGARLKTLLVLGFGVPSLLLVAGVLLHSHFYGTSTLMLRALEPTTVTIDGSSPQRVIAGDVFTREVEQGKHRVEVESAAGRQRYEIDVTNGASDHLIPASPDQCWVAVDVYSTYYNVALGPLSEREPATIEERFRGPAQFDRAYHFAQRDLPQKSGGRTFMMHELNCKRLAQDDAALLRRFGYENEAPSKN